IASLLDDAPSINQFLPRLPMFLQTLAEIAETTGGKILFGTPDRYVRGVFTDTRAVMPGGLFVAIMGQRFDGNAFAADALRAGASAALVSRRDTLKAEDLRAGQGAILVPDTRAAYLSMAE